MNNTALNPEKRDDLRALLIFFIASALLLLVFSACSPLYPLNTWVDPNCFMTVARGMKAGMVPYRDLMEQKGPLLYFIHIIALLISPDSFHGVYPLEVLAHTAFLFAAYKTARLFVKKGVVPLLIAALLVLINCYGAGDSAEMLCLPLLAWSFYDAMRYFAADERRMRWQTLLRNGFFAGCVLWTKFSLLGLHFAFMAVIAIESVLRERKLLPAMRMCGVFLLGMALATAPWLLYFGVNGAIGDCIDVYFVQNIVSYPSEHNLVYNLVHGLGNDALYNLPLALLILIGGLYALLGSGKKRLALKLYVLTTAFCMTLLLYAGGRFRGYTFYIYAVFLSLFAAEVCTLFADRKKSLRTACAALSLCLLTGVCGWELYDSRRLLKSLGTSGEWMAQYRFAEVINQTENPTLLNCGFLDGGFYMAAQVLPTERWFCKLNVSQDDCFKTQSSAVEEGRVDYVVTNKRTLAEMNIDDSLYDMVMQRGAYYLYRLKSLAN